VAQVHPGHATKAIGAVGPAVAPADGRGGVHAHAGPGCAVARTPRVATRAEVPGRAGRAVRADRAGPGARAGLTGRWHGRAAARLAEPVAGAVRATALPGAAPARAAAGSRDAAAPVIELNTGHLAQAIAVVGLAVAATDRIDTLRAGGGPDDAGPTRRAGQAEARHTEVADRAGGTGRALVCAGHRRDRQVACLRAGPRARRRLRTGGAQWLRRGLVAGGRTEHAEAGAAGLRARARAAVPSRCAVATSITGWANGAGTGQTAALVAVTVGAAHLARPARAGPARHWRRIRAAGALAIVARGGPFDAGVTSPVGLARPHRASATGAEGEHGRCSQKDHHQGVGIVLPRWPHVRRPACIRRAPLKLVATLQVGRAPPWEFGAALTHVSRRGPPGQREPTSWVSHLEDPVGTAHARRMDRARAGGAPIDPGHQVVAAAERHRSWRHRRPPWDPWWHLAGGPKDNSSFVFSAIDDVDRELGAHDYF